MNQILEFEKAIKHSLKGFGAKYSIQEIIADTRTCKHEILRDNLEHGKGLDDSFWNLISDGTVTIITVFETLTMSVYVLSGSENTFFPIVGGLAMADVSDLKIALNEKLSIHNPTAVLKRNLAEYWLSVG